MIIIYLLIGVGIFFLFRAFRTNSGMNLKQTFNHRMSNTCLPKPKSDLSVNKILDKISSKGIKSLTPKELEFLKKKKKETYKK